MSNREDVLGFLNSISPNMASNADIVLHTRIKPHQQVFQITQRLMKEGRINGQQTGREWHFSAKTEQTVRSPQQHSKGSPEGRTPTNGALDPAAFEHLCQQVMSRKFDAILRPARVGAVRKQFDLVSADETIIGDAKYYTAVNGSGLPPAKFATIAEYVWLLEKTRSKQKFLVFGNDRRVPQWWLERYGNLLNGVEFYFLTDDGKLDALT